MSAIEPALMEVTHPVWTLLEFGPFELNCYAESLRQIILGFDKG